ncbi:MAG: hypothetical protein DWQ04_26395 [Chloroflexi bacterium]|nr:MAG: hypothetical protein DWQ04_26395 [Chloroflexota bacterium]
MDFSDFPVLFILGFGGAAALELLKLYDYRGKLTKKKYNKLMKSFSFWVVVLGMLVASGFIAWAFHAGSQDLRIWNVVMTGMAARSIVREAVSAQVVNASTKLGDQDSITAKDIFA